MTRFARRFRSPRLALLALTLMAAPALAEVPQDMTFTGRLVDSLGDPLTGPVNLELRVFQTNTGPTQLYSEQHLAVALDATGGFSVQLGLGTSPSGTFDASLFAGMERWLEVLVGAEVLTPRQVIAAVPWALIAQQANELVRDPSAPRFEDCGDGTVADHWTGLQWEKKTGTVGSAIDCEAVGCPDPHIVNNLYEWSDTATDPDGGAFTDFLSKLNDPVGGEASTSHGITGCFAGQCDWRLPNIAELRGVRDTGTGSPNPCINAIFGATSLANYWSASTLDGWPSDAWDGDFSNCGLNFNLKTGAAHVRAVRIGSCPRDIQ